MTKRQSIARALMECLEPRVFLTGSPVTGYGDVPLSAAPALPAKYGTFIDPDFGTKIIRVTDSSNGTNNHVAYSYWPTFNKDSTYFQINSGGGGVLYSFNPTTLAVAKVGSLYVGTPPSGVKPNWEDSIWSSTDPKSITGHEGPRIWSYNVETHVYTLIKDFTGTPGWVAGEKVSQASHSLDDDVWAFHKTDASGTKTGYEVWKRSTNTYPLVVDLANVGGVLDEVQIDKSGRYLVAKSPGLTIRMRIYDITTGGEVDLTSAEKPPGHSDNGSGFLAGYEGWTNHTNLRQLSNPTVWTDIWIPPPADQGGALWQDGHLSDLSDADQWALHSKILYNLPANQGKTGPFLNELFAVATDGSGRVIRFAHHRSKVTDQSTEYWDCPMANISRDGRFVAYNSDWNDSGQRDVFIAVMPIPGDANMDYLVNQTDWNIWNTNQGGTNKTWAQGDWDADHDVDNADLALWTANQTGGGGLPTVTISATDATASETLPNNGVWTVTRTGATTAALVVNFTKSGTATNGTDYNSIGTSVTIPIGASSATVTLTPVNDTIAESSETAILTLSSSANYTIGSPSAATVTILDNDTTATVTLTANDTTAAEDSATGPSTGQWTVTRTGSTAAALVVNFTKSGTATNGTDYASIGTSVTIPIGSASATITVTPLRDDVRESSETVILTLASGTGYTIGSPSAGTVTITDNGLIAYEGFNYTVGDGTQWLNGGAGFTGGWTVSNTTNTGIYSGSLAYSVGAAALKTAANSSWLWKQANASRPVNTTYGTDDTSLWIGFAYRQATDGGAAILHSSLWLGSDATNNVQLGTPWSNFFGGQAYVGGTRYYMPNSTIAPVDGATTFVVYRIDFGHASGTPVADKVRLWVNPTPGTIPSDASANSTWTLPAGVYFNFTDSNLKLNNDNYYNRTTFDEIRLGTSYYAVAPDPIVLAGPMSLKSPADVTFSGIHNPVFFNRIALVSAGLSDNPTPFTLPVRSPDFHFNPTRHLALPVDLELEDPFLFL